MPELKLVVEEKRGAIDVFIMWLPRPGVAPAFVLIGITEFNNDPRGEWFKMFEQIGLGQWFRSFTGAMQVAGAILRSARAGTQIRVEVTLGSLFLTGGWGPRRRPGTEAPRRRSL